MANLLVFDTSTEWCSAAVISEQGRFHVAQQQPRKHAQLLMPMIDDVMKQAQMTPAQLDGIAFGKGPGSFTGLRIAISVAQGLCLASGAKALGISTLQALAWQAMKIHPCKQVLASINAHMGEVFYGGYRATEGAPEAIVADGLCKPEAFDFNQFDQPEQWFGAGDGLALLKDSMPEKVAGLSSADAELAPLAAQMLDLAIVAWQRGEFTDIDQQQPVYLRDSVAWKKLSEQPSLLKK